MKWRITSRVESHRNPLAVNYPCVLLELDGSEPNVRPRGACGNIMLTDNEFMEGFVLLMSYSPTIRQRVLDYIGSVSYNARSKPVETLAEILL